MKNSFQATEKAHFIRDEDSALPEDLAKLVLEVTTGGVQVIQIGQNTAFSRGTVCRVHTGFHHNA